MDKAKHIILWLGTMEWEYFGGTAEEAEEYARADHRYENYGRSGYMIVENKPVLIRKEDITIDISDWSFEVVTDLKVLETKKIYHFGGV